MKNKTAIIIAIFSAIIGIFLIMSYITKIEEEVVLDSNIKNVLIAKKYIPKFSIVTPDMIKISQVPAKYLQPGSIRNVKELLDKNSKPKFVTIAPIMEKEIILSTKLTVIGRETGLSVVIPRGKRAISIPISDSVASSGLIRPGNKVDLIATFEDKSAFLLQNLLVLAVGDSIIGSIEKKEKRKDLLSSLEGSTGGASITLAVTPDEALKIAYAKDKCSFNIVLRSSMDNEIVKISPISLRNLLGTPVKPRSVEIYKGNQSIRQLLK